MVAGVGLGIQAQAETVLDSALASPDDYDNSFRKLAIEGIPLSYPFPLGEAWGVSAGGKVVAGDTTVSDAVCASISGGNSCDLIAAAWLPGEGDGIDEPVILGFDLAQQDPATFVLFSSVARAVDDSGDTIAGYATLYRALGSSRTDAMAWTRTAANSWTAFKLNPGTNYAANSQAGARGVSRDGEVAVGWAASPEFGTVRATFWERTGPGFDEWEAGKQLGVLAGTSSSVANGIALSGSDRIIVGWSGDTGCNICAVIIGSDDPENIFFPPPWLPQPVYWVVDAADAAAGPTALALLPGGTTGDATAISADASTIVGWSEVTGGFGFATEAVLWRNKGAGFAAATPKPLGSFGMPSSLKSKAPFATPLGSVALAVSEKGDAVGGYQAFIDSSPFTLAFIWTSGFADGKGRYLGDVLEQGGVKLGDWVLYTATGVRSTDDGFIVVGAGCPTGELDSFFCSGDPGYIVRIGPGTSTGITTPEQQIESFNEISAAALAIGTNVGATLDGLQEIAENHRCIRPEDAAAGWCFFTFGAGGFFDEEDIDSAGQFSGDVGIAHYFTPVTSAGVSVGAGQVDTSLNYDGNYRSNEVHVGGYVARIPDMGLRLFGAGVWGDLSSVDLTRGYLNGEAIARSFGETDGNGWGLLGRVGWGMRASAQTLLTPFAQITYTDADLDGYRETGGPFPASFDAIETNTTVGRLGVLEETDLSSTIRVFTSLAWAQVLDAETPTVRGAVLDIFELSTDAAGNQSGWAEVMAGGRYQLSESGVLSVSGRASTEFDSYFALGGFVGYSQTF